MNLDPMSAFTIGKSLRKNPVTTAVGGALEDFKTKRDLENKFGMQLALERGKAKAEKEADWEQFNKMSGTSDGDVFSKMSSIASKLPEGSDIKTPFGTVRGPYRSAEVLIEDPRNPGQLINTGQRITRGSHVTKKQYSPTEQLVGKQAADTAKASFDSLLQDMEKDPDLYFKASNPFLKHTVPMAASKLNLGLKEMMSEAGGKTLTEGEKQIVKDIFPKFESWLVGGDDAKIASRYALKVLSALRERQSKRLATGDMNSAPEFTLEDMSRIEQESRDEYQSITSGNANAKTNSNIQSSGRKVRSSNGIEYMVN